MRDLITTLLELAGLLFLTAAAALFVGHYSVPGGLAVAGVLLIGSSALVAALAKRPTRGDEVG